ncbi:hypothetical protein [Planktosalinus lacus]|nr:hypothetical protein [Planktosalinus lacus]
MNYTNRFLLLIICAGIFSSCFTNKMVTKKPGISINNINYTLTKVAQNGRINHGPGYAVVKDKETGKNGKFYLIELTMKNLSKDEKKFDLTKVCLCDVKKNCFTPTRIELKSIIDLPSKRIITLKPNKKRGRKLIFAGPKNFQPKYVLLNSESEELIEFEYEI